jgi:hypothetical protein
MVSFVRREQRTEWLGFGKRLARLSPYTRLISLILLLLLANTSLAQQGRSTRVELVTRTNDDRILLHMRVPRGQTIESAELVQGNELIVLEAEPVQLPETQWILLDASDEMVNLQSVVQSSVQRFWRGSSAETGLIFYNSAITRLRPTSDAEQVDGFLTGYTATASEPACLGQAIAAINDTERDLDRSWRILIVTAGDFSRQASCEIAELAALPAPVDIIAITDEVDTALQELVASSGGNFITANLRTVEARVNEIRAQWGQPTYLLSGDWSADFDASAPFDVSVTLSNGTEETTTIRLHEYNLPLPPAPTVAPTEIQLATIPPRATDTAVPEETEVAVINNQPTPEATNSDSGGGADNVAFLLIIGAVLFVVGAVVLALALSRVRRPGADNPSSRPSYYESLSAPQAVEAAMSATKIRERGIIEDQDIGETRIAPEAAGLGTPTQAAKLDDTYMEESAEFGDEDELLVTQVLTDERFKEMVKQSKSNEEIVGWMRLSTEGESTSEDFPLSAKGAVIGRSLDCDIRVKEDRAISRQHARLDVRPNGQVTISRLSAVNPVVVGGVQVSNRHPLKPNDVIHLSDRTRLVYIAKDTDFVEDTTQF